MAKPGRKPLLEPRIKTNFQMTVANRAKLELLLGTEDSAIPSATFGKRISYGKLSNLVNQLLAEHFKRLGL